MSPLHGPSPRNSRSFPSTNSASTGMRTPSTGGIGREYGWLPTFASDDVSTVISAHPHRPQMRREVGKLLRCEAYWSGCTQNDFDRTLAALGAPSSQESLPPPVVIPAAWVLEMQPEAPDPYRGGVIEVLQTAYRLGASDVFFEDEGLALAFAAACPESPKCFRPSAAGTSPRSWGP